MGIESAREANQGTYSYGTILSNRYIVLERLTKGTTEIYLKDELSKTYLVVENILDKDSFLEEEESFLEKSGQLLVLQVFPSYLFESTFSFKIFEAELLAAQRLLHPHIVPIYDTGRLDDGNYFVVSDYLEGITLREIISDGDGLKKLPIDETLYVLYSLTTILNYVHKHKLCHRFLNPNVVLLSELGAVKLSGFGLGTILTRHSWQELYGSNESTSEAHFRKMTQKDLSNEIGRSLTNRFIEIFNKSRREANEKERKPVDARSDIYSLGVLALTMISGKEPTEKERTADIFENLSKKTPKWIRRFIAKCISQEPMLRYQSSSEALRELELRMYQHSLPLQSESLIRFQSLWRNPISFFKAKCLRLKRVMQLRINFAQGVFSKGQN